MTVPSRVPRILVVEDDSDFGPMLQNSLLGFTKNVDLVVCVDEATEALGTHPYDLLVVDIWLPQTRTALEEKRMLEADYDRLTRELMELRDDQERQTSLRERMEDIIAEARTKLERRGGLMIIEELRRTKGSVGAILFLTAIGSNRMREDATLLAESCRCRKFVYLVKPQSPEAIQAHAKELLR